MGELIAVIAKYLVSDASSLNVKETLGKQSILIELYVSSKDMGKVIGRQGKIAKAIRTLAKTIAIKENKKVLIEIKSL